MPGSREMPKYLCHKIVWALKIASIVFDDDSDKEPKEDREKDEAATITPEEEGYAPFRVDFSYLRKHQPQAGGYYVVYDDGYKSFSHAKAFEEGHSPFLFGA